MGNSTFETKWDGKDCTAKVCTVVLSDPPLLRGVVYPAVCVSTPDDKPIYLDNMGDGAFLWLKSSVMQEYVKPPQKLFVQKELESSD